MFGCRLFPTASTVSLLFNFLASLAWFCVGPNGAGGSGFGLSILWAIFFTPCSFVCWYRPMYKAFRYVRGRVWRRGGGRFPDGTRRSCH